MQSKILYPVCCMLNSKCIMPYPDCKCVSRYVHWNYWIILRSSAVLNDMERNAFYITCITMMDSALWWRLCGNARCRIYEYYLYIIQVNFVKLSMIIYKIQVGEGLQDTVRRRFTRYSLEKVYKIQFEEGLQDTVRRRFTRYSSEKVYKIQFG